MDPPDQVSGTKDEQLASSADLSSELLAWYRREARDLPWRRTTDPYAILLSEVMLQQTRVDVVVPYFERFLARWPTLGALAAATDEEVLSAWAGLGYYGRARRLLAATRAAAATGGLPDSVEALRTIPGIGPYTAGAVASIAFGVRTPAVDGNVERVVCRLDGLTDDPRAAGRAAVWDRVAALHAALPDGASPGHLTQALMELGATVCLPRRPRCGVCPVAAGCVARRAGAPEALPRRPARRPPVPVRAVAGLLSRGDRVLLGRRPPDGLLGGLWEPIGADVAAGDPPGPSVVRAFRERAGVRVDARRALGEIVHVFTHRRLTCAVWAVDLLEGTPEAATFYTDVRWTRPTEVALSTLAKRVLAVAPTLPLAG